VNRILLALLEQFRNYCGLIKVARCGFPWEKTTKRALASVYTNCETALGETLSLAKPGFLPVQSYSPPLLLMAAAILVGST
jgi:hypothetical protein